MELGLPGMTRQAVTRPGRVRWVSWMRQSRSPSCRWRETEGVERNRSGGEGRGKRRPLV